MTSINIAFDQAEDNMDVCGYYIYCDGEKVGETTGVLTYKDKNLEENKVYEYSVKAFDESGNIAENSKSVKTYVTKTKISSISPSDNTVMGGIKETIRISAEDRGNNSSFTVNLSYRHRDGDWIELCKDIILSRSYGSTFEGSYVWDMSGLTDDGSYDLKVFNRIMAWSGMEFHNMGINVCGVDVGRKIVFK